MKKDMTMKFLVSAVSIALSVLSASADGAWGEAWGGGAKKFDLTGTRDGGAVLTNGDLTAEVDEIRLRAGVIAVDRIELQDKAIRIVGDASGTTLKSVTGRANPDCGGVISAVGGSVTLTNIWFDSCAARTAGGAVALRQMTGDSVIADCHFSNCTFSEWASGLGGAVSATAKRGTEATLFVRNSEFIGCTAISGGAISTEFSDSEGEAAMTLDVDSCAFRSNAALSQGGALLIEGSVSIANTLFEGNVAEDAGGAICAETEDESLETIVRTAAGTVFRGNGVTGAYSSGGAIALTDPGITLSVANTAFESNAAVNFGGAICSFGEDNAVGVTTSVFSNNVLTAANDAFGAVLDVECGDCAMTNVTVRGSNASALDFFETDAEIVNCVVVDNGELDISSSFTNAAPFLTVSRSAFGSLWALDDVEVTTNECLAGRTAADYDGNSLYLKGSPYNPVAAEGLVQTAADFDGVAYGSRPYGYSMGAFECGTESCVSGTDVTCMYDGEGHTNKFAAGSAALSVDWEYATAKDGPWSVTEPAFTNAGSYTTWAKATFGRASRS